MCTMPTGLPSSTTKRTVNGRVGLVHHGQRLADQHVGRRSVFGDRVITSSTVLRAAGPAPMWRRRSPSVTMPTSAPASSTTPTQPKPFSVITAIASPIGVPSGDQRQRVAAVHDVADEMQAGAELAAGMEEAEILRA